MRRERLVAGLVFGLFLLPPAASWAQVGPNQCGALGQVTFVHDAMHDLYYWYRELPDLNPALFDSPEAYLEAARYRPLDTTFSYIGSRVAEQAFYSDSQFIGYGFGTKLVAGDELRVTQVFPESPAQEAGLLRGHRILEIGGRTIADLLAAGAFDAAFGPASIGHPTEVLFRDSAGRETRVTMVKRLVTIPTVSLTRVYDVAGRRVGYVFFRNFVQPSFAALDAAFAELSATGVDDLVLDLRYNGGGLVSVAQHLGGLVGGARTTGQVFTRYVHNDKNSFRDATVLFEDAPGGLGLERLIVITTKASASASELVINALRPFARVVIVGESTYGKPVGQYGLNFCEKVLYPVSFSTRNARDEGDYFGGFPPDCPAADDIGHAFGDPAEASLAEALHFVRTGSCSAEARAAGRPAPVRPRASGWQVLLGAH